MEPTCHQKAAEVGVEAGEEAEEVAGVAGGTRLSPDPERT